LAIPVGEKHVSNVSSWHLANPYKNKMNTFFIKTIFILCSIIFYCFALWQKHQLNAELSFTVVFLKPQTWELLTPLSNKVLNFSVVR
jgi:hypothetical protein